MSEVGDKIIILDDNPAEATIVARNNDGSVTVDLNGTIFMAEAIVVYKPKAAEP